MRLGNADIVTSRGRFIAGGTALAATPLAAAPPATVTTQFSWLANVEYAGFFLAESRGDFERASIRPRFLPGGPRLPSVAAVVANGDADVGVDELDKVVDAISEGHDLVILGALYQRPVGGLLSLPERPLIHPRDLVGARIGLQSGGREYIDGILRLAGLPLRYTVVAVGESPEPLVERRCDGFLCYLTNQPLMLADRNVKYVARSLTSFGYYGYDGCLFVRRRTLRERRETLARYVRAVRAGWRANIADPDAGSAATLARTRANAEDARQQRRQNRLQGAYMQGPTTERRGLLAVDAAGVARAYRTLRAEGRREPPPFERVFDLSLLT